VREFFSSELENLKYYFWGHAKLSDIENRLKMSRLTRSRNAYGYNSSDRSQSRCWSPFRQQPRNASRLRPLSSCGSGDVCYIPNRSSYAKCSYKKPSPRRSFLYNNNSSSSSMDSDVWPRSKLVSRTPLSSYRSGPISNVRSSYGSARQYSTPTTSYIPTGSAYRPRQSYTRLRSNYRSASSGTPLTSCMAPRLTPTFSISPSSGFGPSNRSRCKFSISPRSTSRSAPRTLSRTTLSISPSSGFGPSNRSGFRSRSLDTYRWPNVNRATPARFSNRSAFRSKSLSQLRAPKYADYVKEVRGSEGLKRFQSRTLPSLRDISNRRRRFSKLKKRHQHCALCQE